MADEFEDPETAATSDGKPRPNRSDSVEAVARDQLRSYIERIEYVEREIQELKGDRSDIYGEAKGNGFDTRAIRKIVALRKKDKAEREEEEAILDTYLHALGMI